MARGPAVDIPVENRLTVDVKVFRDNSFKCLVQVFANDKSLLPATLTGQTTFGLDDTALNKMTLAEFKKRIAAAFPSFALMATSSMDKRARRPTTTKSLAISV